MEENSKRARKILVIDDNEIVVTLITNSLKSAGYETDFELDGESALKRVLNHNYDIILLDISLPGLDGFEVCRRLKENPLTENVPVIFISGLDDSENIYRRGLDLGIVDFMKKPFTSSELIFKIATNLRIAKTENLLRQNELLFRSIVNDQSEFVIRHTTDGILTFVNTAFSNYTGKPVNALLGSNFFDQLNIDKNHEIRSEILTLNQQRTFVLEIVLPDGTNAWHKWIQRKIISSISHEPVIQSIGHDITESKINEDNLKQYEYIFNHAGCGIVSFMLGSIYFNQINESYAKMHGYTVEELSTKEIKTVFKDGFSETLVGIEKKILKEGHYSYNSIHIRKDGSTFPALSDIMILKEEDGNYTLIENVIDITESVVATEELTESRERFRSMFISSPDPMAIIKLNGMTFIEVNDNFVKSSKYKREEILNNPEFLFKLFADKSEAKSILELIDNDINRTISNVEVNILTKNQRVYPVLISCSRINFNDSEHIIAIIRNIKYIKKYQESLQKNETKFRLLADYNYNWEFWIGPTGKYIYISPSCERISGYNPVEFKRNPGLMEKLIHPDYVDVYHEHIINEYCNEGPECTFEIRIIDRYGNKKWILHNCNAVYDEKGNFLGRRGSNCDISERKAAQENLLKLSTAVEQVSSSVIITNINGEIEYVNPYFEEKTGYKANEVLGKNPGFLKSGKTCQKVYDELWESISSGKIWQGEFINKKKNNELYVDKAIITPVKGRNLKIVSYISIQQDVTVQKELDREIIQAIISTEEKERSRFASDLHDDLGPLLSTAKLYIKSFESVNDTQKKQIAIEKSVAAIDEAISSIKGIANNLSPHLLKNFGLVSGINSLINKINETDAVKITNNTVLKERFDNFIETTIFRVVAELINNTVKHAHAKHAILDIYLKDKNINISYSDDGIGFVLVDALGKKSSRGLSNISNRIKSIGGNVVFDSNCSGTKVLITAPCSISILS